MCSSQATLTSDDQQHLHVLAGALPESYGAVSCDTYTTYRPIIMAALPLLSKLPFGFISKLVTAINYVMTIADAYCGVAATTPVDARRKVAEEILNKACQDVNWRNQLIDNPSCALKSAGIGAEIERLRATGQLTPSNAPCAFSCIVST